ncbi:FAD/NAD(P)-binding domain-containing protein, partial [Conidiobolus coronatus NRRL 28638]
MIFNIVNQLLLALLVKDTLSSPSSSSDPVCIVGSGITGLSAAHKLKEKGYSVKLFEKNNIVGGKLHAYRKDGIVWNMGPVLFSEFYTKTFELVKKFNIKYDNHQYLDLAGYQPDTGITLPLPQIAKGLLAREAWARYQKIRKNYTIETGLINANPELFVSTSQWLKNNNLQALLPYALFFLTAEGYGHVDDTPAIYFVHLLDLAKDIAVDFKLIPDGFDQIPFALAKDLDVTLNAKVSKIDRSEHGAKVTYSTESGLQTQECSSAILAFPPLLNQVSNIISDLSDEEKDILGQVKIIKYATIANYVSNMKYIGYAPIIPPPFPPKLDGGVPAAIVNHTRGAAVTYHWTRGEFDVGPTDEELALYQSQNDKITRKVFPAKDTQTNLYVKGWDYFPHVTTKSLQDGFYKKFHTIQGKSNIYYATPLLGLEVVEHSIRSGEYIADTF